MRHVAASLGQRRRTDLLRVFVDFSRLHEFCNITRPVPLCHSLFSPSGQSAGQTFGQQGVYNNMSITVSMAGGSGGVGTLPPMGQQVGMSNSNLSNVSTVCSDQQVSDPLLVLLV